MPCGCSLEELLSKIDEDLLLRRKTLLIPHLGNGEASHKGLIQPGGAPRFAALRCDGVYVEVPYTELEASTLATAYGNHAEWGKRRRAIVPTGDNRRAGWARLGAHDCWMRLGENTIEALGQAFLADEARISYVTPSVPAERVTAITILSTLTGAEPLKITINDGFTAVIGGRGSGKSAVLEYLRFGIGRAEADLVPEGGAGRRREREVNLVNQTLAGGWVAVTLDRQGVREEWTRRGDSPQEIEVTTVGGTERLSLAMARQRFPARAFHQKELSTTMVDAASAAENITGIAAAEIVDELRRNEGAIAGAVRSVGTALRNVAGHWQAERELADAGSVVEDLKRRLAALKAQMQAGGVGSEDLATLADAPRHDRASNYLEDVKRRLELDVEAIEGIARSTLSVDEGRYGDALEFHALAPLRTKLSEVRQKVMVRLSELRSEIVAIGSVRDASESEFLLEAAVFQEAYVRAKSAQMAHGEQIAESERLAAALKIAEAAEERAAEDELRSRGAEEAFTEARTELAELIGRRRALLNEAASRVQAKSNGCLVAAVRRNRQHAAAVRALVSLLEASGMRRSDEACAEWLAKALRGHPLEGWKTLCDQLIAVYKEKIAAGSPLEPGAEISLSLLGFLFGGAGKPTTNQISRIYANLSDDRVGAVLTALPEDNIVLTYVSGGRSVPFAQASEGQQASALLELLLRQTAGTLIVDQPEDDLDNRVIMRVVNLIKTSKSKRQLIFTTHNANLVVNGDADKVVTMVADTPSNRPSAGGATIRVEVDGAIETPKVRLAITEIMEGGRDAFDLRARKYRVEAAEPSSRRGNLKEHLLRPDAAGR